MTTERPRRAALYARVSTGGQTTKQQIARLREVAAHHGWDVREEVEETVSGVARARPERDRLLREVRRGRIDVIAAVALDRLGRSLPDLLSVLQEVEAAGGSLYLDREGTATWTPAGRALLAMAGVFAAFERDLIRERTLAGIARARAEGKRIGRPPVPRGTRAAVMSLRREGAGLDRIAARLGLGKGTVQKIVREEGQREEEGHPA